MGKKEAFTLIELLVVIAIIALLMAILMPALSRVRQQGKAVLCQSNLKQMGLIFTLYTEEHNGLFMSEDSGDAKDSWIYAMRPYYSNQQDITVCPTTTHFHSEGVTGTFAGWGIYGEGIYANGLVASTNGDYGSIGFNGWAANDNVYMDGKLNWKTVNVKGGNEIPVFIDCQWPDGKPLEIDEPPAYPGYFTGHWFPEGMKNFCINRHNGFVNGVFMNNTVRHVGLKELWKLKWHRTYNINGPWTKAGNVKPANWPAWMRKFSDY